MLPKVDPSVLGAHLVTLGNNQRVSFAKIKEVQETPYLIEVQKKSYDLFINEGLHEVLRDASGAVTEYSLDLGNGIRIVSPASAVTLSHIKTVIYSSIAAWLLLLLVACPVFRFLSVLLRNVGRKEALNEENARMINYIGLVILIGNTLIVALNNLLNYIQINKFVSMSEHRIEYAFSIEWAGIIMGLFILAVGTIYGYACSVAAHEKETLTTAVTRLSGTGGQDGQG